MLQNEEFPVRNLVYMDNSKQVNAWDPNEG
jgi:hypothetical protein